tara:strand:+ start:769 stop:1470 length:702 start_codon:yes stop_codon:yes gene_type:complete
MKRLHQLPILPLTASEKLNLIILFLARSTLTQRKITTMIRITLILATVFSLAFTQVTAQNFQNGLEAYKAGDYREALDYWEFDAAQGNPFAQSKTSVQSKICLMYESGWVDTKEGDIYPWCELAAQKGDAFAQLHVGLRIHRADRKRIKEFGYEENDEDAKYAELKTLMWIIISSNNGYERANKIREKAASQMSAADISKATAMAKECMASNYTMDGRECHWGDIFYFGLGLQ